MTQTTTPSRRPAAGHDLAVQAVQAEVRELVRRRGVDPVGDPSGVGRLVEEVLAELERHCLDVGLPPPEDPGAVRRAVRDAVAGFGPLQPLLDDPAIEEIWINAPDRVFVARGGHSELTSVILTAAGVSELVERMLLSSGRRVDVSQPFVDAALPDGSRLHVATSEVTRSGWAVNIRKFVVAATSLAELVNLGTLTVSGAQFLAAAVAAGLNIVVSGGTQAGKTTLLNCLLASVPASQRVVTVEEVFELKVPLPDVVALQTRQVGLEGTGEVDLRRLVTEALRMRPDRIVVGEVRRGERHGPVGYRRARSKPPRYAQRHVRAGHRRGPLRWCRFLTRMGGRLPAGGRVAGSGECGPRCVQPDARVCGPRGNRLGADARVVLQRRLPERRAGPACHSSRAESSGAVRERPLRPTCRDRSCAVPLRQPRSARHPARP